MNTMTDDMESGQTQGSIASAAGGFSLIEVLIALFILAVGALSLLGIMLTSINANASNKERLIVEEAIVQEIETIKSANYDALATAVTLTTSMDYSETLSGLGEAYRTGPLAGIDTVNPIISSTYRFFQDYRVYKGLPVETRVNGETVTRFITLKLTMDPEFLELYNVLKGNMKAYWVDKNTLKEMEMDFFIGEAS